MKSKKILLVMIFVMMIGLTACSKGTKDEEIRENIEDELESIMESDEKIIDIKILKKEFDKKESDGLVQSKIISEKDKIQYVRYYNFVYDYDKEDGWKIETFIVANEDKWEIDPLAGIDENDIPQLLDGETITINEEVWTIKEDNISDVTVVSHNTSLKDNKDEVVVSFTIDDYVMRASGELTINLVFDEEWKLDTTEGEDSFSAVEKMEYAHNVTDEDLIEEVLLHELTYGESEDEIFSYYSTEQVISMRRTDISEFVINSEESTSKGISKCYDCNFVLTKRNAVFDVNAIIKYEYTQTEGWTIMSVDLTPSIKSIDIGGDWIGTYTAAGDSGDCVLSINTIDETGNITGIYSYSPYENEGDDVFDYLYEPGSYYVSGNINMDTLCINLTPGEWITEPYLSSFTVKVSISAQLMIDEATMYGSGHSSSAIILTRDY